MTKTNTKTEKVLQYLQEGRELTERQAMARFGVPNMHAVASNLRFKGYPVYANRRSTREGDKTFFRLGSPSRQVIAAGYRALST